MQTPQPPHPTPPPHKKTWMVILTRVFHWKGLLNVWVLLESPPLHRYNHHKFFQLYQTQSKYLDSCYLMGHPCVRWNGLLCISNNFIIYFQKNKPPFFNFFYLSLYRRTFIYFYDNVFRFWNGPLYIIALLISIPSKIKNSKLPHCSHLLSLVDLCKPSPITADNLIISLSLPTSSHPIAVTFSGKECRPQTTIITPFSLRAIMYSNPLLKIWNENIWVKMKTKLYLIIDL